LRDQTAEKVTSKGELPEARETSGKNRGNEGKDKIRTAEQISGEGRNKSKAPPWGKERILRKTVGFIKKISSSRHKESG